MENNVESIVKTTFSSRSYSEKLEKQEIISMGKPKPKLNMTTNFKTKKNFFAPFCNSTYCSERDTKIIPNYFTISQITLQVYADKTRYLSLSKHKFFYLPYCGKLNIQNISQINKLVFLTTFARKMNCRSICHINPINLLESMSTS